LLLLLLLLCCVVLLLLLCCCGGHTSPFHSSRHLVFSQACRVTVCVVLLLLLCCCGGHPSCAFSRLPGLTLIVVLLCCCGLPFHSPFHSRRVHSSRIQACSLLFHVCLFFAVFAFSSPFFAMSPRLSTASTLSVCHSSLSASPLVGCCVVVVVVLIVTPSLRLFHNAKRTESISVRKTSIKTVIMLQNLQFLAHLTYHSTLVAGLSKGSPFRKKGDYSLMAHHHGGHCHDGGHPLHRNRGFRWWSSLSRTGLKVRFQISDVTEYVRVCNR